MSKLPTIKDIAKLLNVSVSTVSRALNDHPSIGLRTRTLVKETAATLNYVPNVAAIQFKKGKTFTIGVILPSLSEDFFSNAISGIEDVANEHNYQLIFGQSHNDIQKEKDIIAMFQRHRVDGIIVSLAKETNLVSHFDLFKEANTPIVYFDRIPKEKNINSVSCDLYKASVDIVDFLWEQGHRDIALIKGPRNLVASTDRMKGVLDGMYKKRVKTDASLFGVSDLSREGTWNAMKDILSQKSRPTAVIAFNDYVALDAITYIKNFTSLKINRDISFVSYSNLPICDYISDSPIASVEQFPYKQGSLAANLLLDLIDLPEKREKPKQIIIDGALMINEKKSVAIAI